MAKFTGASQFVRNGSLITLSYSAHDCQSSCGNCGANDGDGGSVDDGGGEMRMVGVMVVDVMTVIVVMRVRGDSSDSSNFRNTVPVIVYNIRSFSNHQKPL